jgi:hypothetical protein
MYILRRSKLLWRSVRFQPQENYRCEIQDAEMIISINNVLMI